MGAAADALLSEGGEPALDMIEPGSQSGREVHVEPRMAGKPIAYRRRLVRVVVIHHEMDVHAARHVGLYGTQELQELAAAVAPVEFADHLAGGDVQCREQGRRSLAHVVVVRRLGIPGASGRMGCLRSSA